MPVTFLGTGKGLREPCSPYRVAPVFGQPLGLPDANSWNCLPVLTDPTTTFDLTGFTTYSEVVVTAITIQSVPAGAYRFRFVWYRTRDSKMLYDGSFYITITGTGGVYAYSYIGYVDHEIWEDGDYSVDVYVEGPLTYYVSRHFTVTGTPVIPPVEPPPEPEQPPIEPPPVFPEPLAFWDGIVDGVLNIGTWLRTIADYVQGWVYPFYMVSSFFYWVANGFDWLAYYFSLARIHAVEIYNRVLTFLDVPGILSLLAGPIGAAIVAFNWVQDAFNTVHVWIFDWWASTSQSVHWWIDEVRTWAQGMFNAWWDVLSPVYAWFEAFQDNVPTLNEVILWFTGWTANVLSAVYNAGFAVWGDIQSYVDGRVVDIVDMMQGWADVRDEVVLFLQDPLEYLLDKFTGWFLGEE